MLPGLLLLLLIAIASPLPNPQTGSHIPQSLSPESRLQPYGRQSAFWKALSMGPGRDRDTNVWEWDGSGTHTGGSGTGTGELLAGMGGLRMA